MHHIRGGKLAAYGVQTLLETTPNALCLCLHRVHHWSFLPSRSLERGNLPHLYHLPDCWQVHQVKMSHTLFTDEGNFRALKVLVAAEYTDVEIDVPKFKVGTDNKTAAFLAKSPLGRVPVLTTPKGSIFESGAIARYVAGLRRDAELLGSSFVDSAQVDSWIDFNSHELELPATVWYYPAVGLLPYNAAATGKAKGDVINALTVLENHLADKTYMVGHKVTLADITIATTLLYPFKFVADPAFRAPFPNVIRWFTTLVNQPQFQAVVGDVVFAEKELTAGGGAPIAAVGGKASKPAAAPKAAADKPKAAADKPKEAPKPKEEKPKPAKEDDGEEDEAPKEKKEDHPFKVLDKAAPSAFIMDTWKKTYSNCKGNYKGAMASFFETHDQAGWTLFRGDYKYNDELTQLFMTSNLIAGFIQRTEEIRKWLFGTMTIRGEDAPGKMKVTCYYLIRGDSIEPLEKCNDDASCYTWTKVPFPFSDADKATLYDYWCSDVSELFSPRD